MQYRLILVLLVFLFSSQSVLANECSAVFSDGLQNNTNDGTIEFGDGSKLVGSVDGTLASNNPIINNGVNSCDTKDCISSGVAALSVIYDIPGGW